MAATTAPSSIGTTTFRWLMASLLWNRDGAGRLESYGLPQVPRFDQTPGKVLAPCRAFCCLKLSLSLKPCLMLPHRSQRPHHLKQHGLRIADVSAVSLHGTDEFGLPGAALLTLHHVLAGEIEVVGRRPAHVSLAPVAQSSHAAAMPQAATYPSVTDEAMHW